jgi:hypothetical protein
MKFPEKRILDRRHHVRMHARPPIDVDALLAHEGFRFRRWLPFGLVAVSVALAAFGIGLGKGPAAESGHAGANAPDASPRELDRRTIAIREDDEPARLVAEVMARACTDGDAVSFELRASAVGPRVAGAPGPEGLSGGNRITAEELDALIVRSGLVARLDGRPSVVLAKPGRSGHVVERELSADGRVVHVDGRGRECVLDASFAFDRLADGTHDVEVVADGRVRVRARLVVEGTTARIVRLAQVTERGVEVGP